MEVAGGTPPDAPILAPFLAWLSSSPCQGTSLAERIERPPRGQESCICGAGAVLGEETGGLEKLDDESVVARGGDYGAVAGKRLQPARQPTRLRPAQAPERVTGSPLAMAFSNRGDPPSWSNGIKLQPESPRL